MRKSIIFIISLLIITSCKHKLKEPQRFFGDYYLNEGDFKLVGIGRQGEWIDGFKNFCVDDIQTLQKMQEQWVFEYSTDLWLADLATTF